MKDKLKTSLTCQCWPPFLPRVSPWPHIYQTWVHQASDHLKQMLQPHCNEQEQYSIHNRHKLAEDLAWWQLEKKFLSIKRTQPKVNSWQAAGRLKCMMTEPTEKTSKFFSQSFIWWLRADEPRYKWRPLQPEPLIPLTRSSCWCKPLMAGSSGKVEKKPKIS